MLKRRVSLTFTPALVALVLAALLASACSSPLIPNTNRPASEPTPAAVSVTVSDQEFDGTQVVISNVVSQGPGWIAIHIDDNGNYGPPIGFAHVNNGETTNVVVTLDAGKTTPVMYAMLHTDKGEVGKYEFPGPDEPIIIAGEHVAPPFTISAQAAAQGGPASLTIKDQDVSGGRVVIDEVVSPGPGWVAIYIMDENGQRGQDIGFTQVNQGSNPNVTVVIDASQVTTMMYAVLHKDEGEVGTYEFPGPDAPQVADGQEVSIAFHNAAGVAQADPTAAPEATPTEGHVMGGEATPTAGPEATPEAAATPEGGQEGGGGAILPEIEVADQTLVKETLTVPRVFSLGDAWLVLHFANPDGTMGNMVGAAQVKDGENLDVVVPVDTGLVTPTIYAMLHFDKGVRGSLEFPGEDVPVLIRGEVLAPSFQVAPGAEQEVIIDVSKEEGTIRHLVDANGMTLYLSLNDGPGQSNCAEECLETWKPVLAGLKVTAGVGVDQSKLGVIPRPDGSRQVTYLGNPLYTYVDDRRPGDTNGQGLDGIWFLVSP
jgi:predicted lipoprotein with Yx(FWY)xxD motif